MILLLAMQKRGELRYSPDEAGKKLKELRATGDFSKLSIDQSRVLARLAQPKKRGRSVEGYAPRDAGTPTSTLAPMTSGKSIRDRLAAINADPDLLSSDAVKRKKLVDERAQLQAAIATKKRSE